MDKKIAVDAIRILSADAVQKANSGHPGFPLGAAAITYELFANHINHNPSNPDWFNRDRFVLSAGHGSAMMYSILHLFGYEDLSLEEIKQFRQLGSLTPGHPEYGHTKGIDASTGPLGAGMGIGVGMAMAEAHLASVFNKSEFPVVDHFTYVLGGDGCMMEGLTYEALSLAGTLGLGKLIVLYDSNNITIEGNTDIAFTEDVTKRFDAFGFQTLEVEDGNDPNAIGEAIKQAKADTSRPSFIKIHTHIGFGCPAKQDKASAHGEPLGEDNVKALRETLEWQYDEAFYVPDEVYNHYKELADTGKNAESAWNELYANYEKSFADDAALLKKYLDKEIPEDVLAKLSTPVNQEKSEATRSVSGRILNDIKDDVPFLFGGSADLGPSNKTVLSGIDSFSAQNYSGRNVHFGVREQAMGAIALGLSLHGGILPFVSTFFVFSDYVKPMMRLATLTGVPVLYVYTHDSIGVGEDGPTHQPVEQLAMLRSLPGLSLFRPADENETMAAYKQALTSTNPTAIVLSRQNLPPVGGCPDKASKGGYVISKETGDAASAIILASGSEVELAIEAQKILAEKDVDVRVVSMPSMNIFEAQSEEYKNEVLPKAITKRIAVEAGTSYSWGKYVGLDGDYVTMDTFGASAPAGQLFDKYGLTAENVAAKVAAIIDK